MIMNTEPLKIYGMLQKQCLEGNSQQYRPSSKKKKKKKENSQIDNLTHHLNESEKNKQNPEVHRRKEIIKIREEINKIEMQKIIEKDQ